MVAEKKYLQPKTIDEAISFAKAHENDFYFLAGGTDAFDAGEINLTYSG